MRYSVDIERSAEALAYCLQKINNEINDIWDWDIRINAGGIDYGIYCNFDTGRKTLEISNQPNECADDSFCLAEIIEEINSENEEDEE